MDTKLDTGQLIENGCLACLSTTDFKEDISEHLINLFQETFNLQINLEETTSKQLCLTCKDKLVEASEFLYQVKSSICRLENCKRTEKSEVKIEEVILTEFKDNSADSDSDDSDSNFSELSEVPPSQQESPNINEQHDIEKDQEGKEIIVKANCLLCIFQAANIGDLANHMINKHKELVGCWCKKCNKLFDDLEDHELATHSNKIWCDLCKLYLTCKAYLKHLECHTSLKCKECDEEFEYESVLHEHIAIKHNQNTEFECPNCFKTFTEYKRFQKHVTVHGYYTCKVCDKRYESPVYLMTHICDGLTKDPATGNVAKNNNKERKALDDYTIEELSNIDMKSIDKKTHFVRETSTCQFCQKTLKTETSRSFHRFKRHLQSHLGLLPLICEYCGKGFAYNSTLITHELTHTKEKLFVCSVCGKKYANSTSFNFHLMQHNGKPEKCPLCPKRYCRKSELELHLQKHKGVRPYLCTDCGKSFLQKSHLTCHITAHSDERPYSCNKCDKKFKKKFLLKEHEILHGEKKQKCSQCHYSCHDKYRLKQHTLKIHLKAEVKNWPCQLCDKEFTKLSLLNTHKKKSHNVII